MQRHPGNRRRSCRRVSRQDCRRFPRRDQDKTSLHLYTTATQGISSSCIARFMFLIHAQHVTRELYIWSKCQHQNVHRLLGLVEFRGQIGAVSYWMQKGSLPSYLRGHPEADRCQIVCRSLGLLYSKFHLHVYLFIEHRHMRRSGVLACSEDCKCLCSVVSASSSLRRPGTWGS